MDGEDNHEDKAVNEVKHLLMQDINRRLSQALANTPHARLNAREAAELIKEKTNGNTRIKSKG
jgi:hypothetical protein